MARQDTAYLALNRGLVSRLGLARADIKRLALAAETFRNWMPRVLGSMMVRPGLKYLAGILNDAAEKLLPFVFSTSDKALIELTTYIMRVYVSDAPITRPAVTTVVTGGDFPSGASLAANWADDDEAGAVSSWISAGLVGFTGTGTLAARRTATVTVAGANVGVEHALRIVVDRGPLTLRVGSTAGGDEYINETVLGTGTHSLVLTPTADFYIRFQSRLLRLVRLASCTIEAAGTMQVTTPWPVTALDLVRADQSGDVLFVAAAGYQQYKIERRATRSWSVVKYQPTDGPFRVENTGPGTMTPSVLTGNGTLTASIPTFRSTHVGALFAVTSTGQSVSKVVGALNDATGSIRLSGVGTDRTFNIVITALTGTGDTIVLQRSTDNATWTTVTGAGASWTADANTTYADGLDNQIIYYRLLCSVYAAGAPVLNLNISIGSIRGICRVTDYTSNVLVSIEVLSAFGGVTATATWEEGKWSDFRGWPTSVGFYEGRLGWAGKDGIVLSVSDGFESFDPTLEGDSGPIDRTIGTGPVDTINWMLALQRLILGGQGAEFSCRSTSFDEPLTPTNFNIKTASTQGSAAVAALKIDNNGIYVQRGGVRVYELSFDSQTYDYASMHLSALVPDIGAPSIVRMAAQRQPDTRIHFVRSDGTVAVLLFDKLENVACWLDVQSDGASGLVEDVVVLPGSAATEEDQVYYVVKRTIGGAAKRFLERWALESEAIGGTLCKIADSFVSYTGVLTHAITGLSHLEGKQVVVWADGADVGHNDDGTQSTQPTLIYTVSGGQITLAVAATNAVVGLPYTAQWESGKLVQLAQGLALKSHKNIEGLGLIMADVHRKGVQFGPDFTHLDDLPSIEDGTEVGANEVRSDYDAAPFVFPGTWSIDARLCLQGIAPRPATVLAAVCSVEFHG